MKKMRKNCKFLDACLFKLHVGWDVDCNGCELFESIVKAPPQLKPCPFCGGEAEIKKDNTCMGHGDYGSCKWVKCKECGTSTKKYLCDGYYGCECTDEELAEKWNRRV